VNHCVNDILACGAKPLFFLDYFAVGKLVPDVAVQVISGFTKACKENGCALIGGETAEMPSMYQDGEYDVSGTIVGVVDRSKIVDGKNIKAGDVLIGLPSTGLQTNGYSLARNVLFPKYKHDQYFEELGTTLGEALLAVHGSFLNVVHPIAQKGLLKGISHITGGGIIGNTSRIIPDGLNLNINWGSWELPAIFKLIQEAGDIAEEEMRHAFNLGIGMILIADKDNVDNVMDLAKDIKPMIIGDIK
jgi:phosphoribosylformylglycinamidine cyclo-ligase